MNHRFLGLILTVSLGSALQAADPTPEALAHFEKDVRPILVDKCVRCHGPKKQEASLRLDSRAALLKGGDSGPAIVPGQPGAGTLLSAISYQHDVKMPPAGKLPQETIAAITKWVATGAAWPAEATTETVRPTDKHWAFQPLRDPALPTVKTPALAPTPLDRFIQAQLEVKGLTPNSPADRRTLIRRVTFDLTGLPPTPEEIDAFLADRSPNAFAKVVDRLLASPAYGERWGRHWLDVARYADTAGDGADYPVREARLYRDWVIQAFNRDLPFADFVKDQIAGDIRAKEAPADQYADRVTATGFMAIGKRYGYNPSPDYQYLDFADVIDSVGRSMLGLSLGCARCHDHKYDPVTMADYYGLYGILQSTRWSFPGGEEHKRPVNFPPRVPPAEAARREKARAEELAKFDAKMAQLSADRAALDGKSHAGGIDLGLEGQPIGKPPAAPWLAQGPNSVHADAQSPYRHIHPAGTRGVRMGSGQPTDGIRYVWPTPMKTSATPKLHLAVDFRTAAMGTQTGAYRFYFGRGVIESLAVEVSVTRTEIAIRSGGAKWTVVRPGKPGTWTTLQITIDSANKTYSGTVGVPGDLTTFGPLPLNPTWDGVLDTFICDGIGHIAGPAPERDVDNLGLMGVAFATLGSAEVKPRVVPPDAKEKLAAIDAELAKLKKQREQMAATPPYEVAYGVSEGAPSNAKIQKRGEPDKLGPEVPRRFLGVLGGDPLPPGSTGSGRQQLAEWVARPTNPLTARVFVNRVWQWHFGRGIVPTPSDFGTRGEPPTHPELLDWLTSRFLESGGSLKQLHRLILASATYQRSSDDTPAALAADPESRWLWRYPRRPLDAESIRDAMLVVSGDLDRSPPGEHPFPPVESWGFTIHAPFHAVYDSNRRSVYLMVQRNRRHPYLALFDGADPNQSTPERLPTITPTQSLYLMNSPFVHERAAGFARKLLAIPGDESARIQRAIALSQGRVAEDAEVTRAKAFLNDYRQRLPAGTPAERDQAAWAAYARVLLTSNAFLYVD